MDIRFDNKNVVVTGASTGIGSATAIEFGRAGANVIVNYLSSADAAAEVVGTIKRSGGTALAVQADVSKADEVKRLVEAALEFFDGRIDILINNAGSLLERKGILEMDESLWDQCMDINLKSVFLCCQAVAPIMKKGEKGIIINVSSIAARNGGGVGASHYSSSKAAVSAFTKGLAKELAGSGITVNNIAPGIIATPFHEKFTPPATYEKFLKSVPLGRAGMAEEIAFAILFMASPYAAYITGETLEVNGGLLMD
jgi:3-oxoacyl-[acyl-carrier protein] reductase